MHEIAFPEIGARALGQKQPHHADGASHAGPHERGRAFVRGHVVRILEPVIHLRTAANEAARDGGAIAERSQGQWRCDIIQRAFDVWVSPVREQSVHGPQVAARRGDDELSRAILMQRPDAIRPSQIGGKGPIEQEETANARPVMLCDHASNEALSIYLKYAE